MNTIQEEFFKERKIKIEWTGCLPIDEDEGYLLTFEDGSKVLFSYYQSYDCVGSALEIIEKREKE